MSGTSKKPYHNRKTKAAPTIRANIIYAAQHVQQLLHTLYFLTLQLSILQKRPIIYQNQPAASTTRAIYVAQHAQQLLRTLYSLTL